MEGAAHTPVLLAEVLAQLSVDPAGTYVDCTFGRGGHARGILARLGPNGRLLVIDRDREAIDAGLDLARQDRRVVAIHGAFGELEKHAAQAGIVGGVYGVLFDLGVSSPQLEDPERGFSFSRAGPLDMRMDRRDALSAACWLARARLEAIAEVLWRYGEERYARRIARAIVAERGVATMLTTDWLRDLITRAKPRLKRSIDPATRSFQALRIFINDELGELARALPQALGLLRGRGRLAVISFHSLEDRMVKRYLRDEARGGAGGTIMERRAPALRLVCRPMRPCAEEQRMNPRARSAVLRVAEKLA